MKFTTLKILAIAILSIAISSCGKDEPTGGNGGGSSNAPIILDCLHNTDITLTNQNPDGIDYTIDCDLEIRDGIFSIEAGTTIQFSEGASLTVENDGIFRARGNSGLPITLTGTDQGRASWRGIFINNESSQNDLEHVIIEDAGDGESFGLFTNSHAAITFQGRISMINCTIKNSGTNGILSEESLNKSQIDDFRNNTIIGCNQFPILVDQNLITDMDLKSCVFEENGTNMIGMHQEGSDLLSKESVFESADIPYFIDAGIELRAPLTLEAGVEIIMNNGSYITSTSNNSQYLLIQGSQSNHVTIRGKESISGYWDGIYIREPSSLNIWEFLDLSDAGGTVQGFGNFAGNVTLEFGGNLTINDCTSARSGGSCDIVISSFGGVSTLENNSPGINNICEE